MTIEQINSDKIKVVVDKNEQREYGVTYASMNYSDQNTRRLCESIIKTASKQMGFSIGNARLLVEAHRGNNGAVTLFLSRVPICSENGEEYLCQTVKFVNADALLDGCALFGKVENQIQRSSLYLYKNAYFLYFEMVSEITSARRFLDGLLEYGEATPLDIVYIAEHGKAITENDALEKMLH